MSYTLTETGKVLTETQEGVTMPADYSFATVNDYVHSIDRQFEELQWLALGMASHIDKLDERNRKLNRCSRCLKQTDGIHTCTPTPEWFVLEQQRDELLAALEAGINLIDLISPFEGAVTRQINRAIANAKGGAV